jgi:2-oxoglutarate ferredoxin oxidoreductase subunit gamma
VMFAGQLLAHAGMDAGLEVTWIPSYGPEMRGGTAHCFVVLSDASIGSPIVSRPEIAVVFNNPSFEKYEPLVAAGGLLVYNKSLISHKSHRHDIDLLPVPATDTAYELGEAKLTNMVLLGAVLSARPVVSVNALKQALTAHIPPHRAHLLEKNYAALEAGSLACHVT